MAKQSLGDPASPGGSTQAITGTMRAVCALAVAQQVEEDETGGTGGWDVSGLPFVSGKVGQPGHFNLWDVAQYTPLSSTNWSVANTVGAYFAVEAMEWARLTGDSEFVAEVIRSMPSESCGIAAGFVSQIGLQLGAGAA